MKPHLMHHTFLAAVATSVALMGSTALASNAHMNTNQDATGAQLGNNTAAPGSHTLGNNGTATNGTGSSANPAATSIQGGNGNGNAGAGAGVSTNGAGVNAGANTNGGIGANSNTAAGTGLGSNAGNDNAGGVGMGRGKMVTNTREIKRVRNVLAHFVNDTVQTNGLRHATKYLARQDRKRFSGQLKNSQNKALNGRIRELRKDWKAKYGQEFKISHPSAVFSNIQVMQRSTSKGALTVLLQAPAGLTGSSSGSQRTGMSSHNSLRRHGTSINAAQQKNGLQAGATISGNNAGGGPGVTAGANGNTLTANGNGIHTRSSRQNRGLHSQGMSGNGGMAGSFSRSVRLHFVRQGRHTYRLQLPAGESATRFRKAVQYVLTKCDQNRSQWPGNVNQGYQAVSYKLFKAISRSHTSVSSAQMHH